MSAGGAVEGRASDAAPSGSAPSQSGAWPLVRHDAGNSGYAPGATGPVGNVETRWSADLGGAMHTAVTDGELIYAGSYLGDNSIYALDPDSGEVAWQQGLDVGLRNAPAVGDGRVYLITEDFRTYSYAAADGAREWEYFEFDPEVNDAVFHSPVYADGTVYLAVPARDISCGVHAIDAASGTRKWRYSTRFWTPTGTPAVGEGTVFVPVEQRLVALDAQSGEERWHYDVPGTLTTPSVVDGTVYAGANGNVYAWNAADGSLEWRYVEGFSTQSALAVGPRGVYFEDGGTVVALDREDGTERWSYHAGGFPGGSAPVVGEGYCYYWVWNENVLHGVGLAEGSEVWTLDLGSTNDRDQVEATPAPTLVGDTLYLGNLDGSVYAVGGDPPETTTTPPPDTTTTTRGPVDTQAGEDDEASDSGGGVPFFRRFPGPSLLPQLLLGLTLAGYLARETKRRRDDDGDGGDDRERPPPPGGAGGDGPRQIQQGPGAGRPTRRAPQGGPERGEDLPERESGDPPVDDADDGPESRADAGSGDR